MIKKKQIIALIMGMVFLCVLGCGDENVTADNSNAYKKVKIKGNTYYAKTGSYEGEFYYDEFVCCHINQPDGFDSGWYIEIDEDENKIVNCDSEEYEKLGQGVVYDFEQYDDFCQRYYVNREYDDKDKNYIIVYYAQPNSILDFELLGIEYDEINDTIDYFYNEDVYGVMADGFGIVCVIPTDVAAGTPINMIYCVSEEEIKNLKKYGTVRNPDDGIDGLKPVIYLYPEEDNTDIEVWIETNNSELVCTYPKYNDGWSVTADKDGLIKANGTEYNYLYWEGKSYGTSTIEEGFCVKGSDTAEFLDEKLAQLGLNRKEANEFIVYWLPLMEQNEYNVISFDTTDYEESYKLHVNPTPDTVIRVFMTWYGTDEAVDIKPQNIETPKRKGFTVLEWGGAELGGYDR